MLLRRLQAPVQNILPGGSGWTGRRATGTSKLVRPVSIMPHPHAIASAPRREMLKFTAKGALGLMAAACLGRPALAAGVLAPVVTEGPFCLDSVKNGLLRSDIRTCSRTGKTAAGYPLQLIVNLSAQNAGGGISPLAGAFVDIWHCDADGNYSRESNDGAADLSGVDYLRGYQVTDAGGTVRFVSIYPGWYHGRTTHIHARVRLSAVAAGYDQTTQFYFDEDLTARIYTTASPYAARGPKDTRNADDGIYNGGSFQSAVDGITAAAGSRTLLTLTDTGGVATAAINLVIAPDQGIATLHCPTEPAPLPFGGGRPPFGAPGMPQGTPPPGFNRPRQPG